MISSGPRALSDASLAIASQTCLIVISAVNCTPGGYITCEISSSLAGGGWGKKPFWRSSTFCLWEAECSSSVGIKDSVSALVMYLLTCYMNFSFALLMNSLHLSLFAYLIWIV